MARDHFSGNLFEGQPQHPPEILKLNEKGEIVDKEGNVHDERGNIIREKPSSELERAMEIARKQYPGIESSDPLVQFYVKKFKRENAKKEIH